MSDEDYLMAELEAARREIERLRERIRLATALTDTGSEESKWAFGPLNQNGWRVVERIREVLTNA